MLKHCLTSLLFVIFSVCAVFSVEPTTVGDFDLTKYQGTWFEIARFPNPFQNICKKNATARYRILDDGYIEVSNTCIKEDASVSAIKGLARKQGTDSDAKLEVSFFEVFGWRPVWGDYWVLYVDADYQFAVVGDRNQKYGWVLGRSTVLSENQKDTVYSVLEKNGYAPEALIYTPHDS